VKNWLVQSLVTVRPSSVSMPRSCHGKNPPTTPKQQTNFRVEPCRFRLSAVVRSQVLLRCGPSVPFCSARTQWMPSWCNDLHTRRHVRGLVMMPGGLAIAVNDAVVGSIELVEPEILIALAWQWSHWQVDTEPLSPRLGNSISLWARALRRSDAGHFHPDPASPPNVGDFQPARREASS